MAKAGNLVLCLIIVNLAGALFGFYYYQEQLLNMNPLLWLFVADCPLYVVAFAIALMFMEKKKQNDAVSFIISVGLLKYALWTLFVLSAYHQYYFMPKLALVNGTLFLLHIGMAAEAFVLKIKKFSVTALFLALGWFLLNDSMDYFVGTLPYLPNTADIPMVAGFSFASTLLLVPLLWILRKEGWRVKIFK